MTDTYPLATEHEWLREIAATTGREDFLGTADIDGRRYLVASDSIIIVAVAAPDAPEKALLADIFDYINKPPDTEPLDLVALRAFLATLIPPTETCQRCAGKGKVQCLACCGTGVIDCECGECGHEHEADCEECEDGMAPCVCADAATTSSRIRFALAGLVFDARRFARFLAHLPGDVAQMRPQGGRLPLLLGTSDWRVAIMPVQMPTDGLPVFPVEAKT